MRGCCGLSWAEATSVGEKRQTRRRQKHYGVVRTAALQDAVATMRQRGVSPRAIRRKNRRTVAGMGLVAHLCASLRILMSLGGGKVLRSTVARTLWRNKGADWRCRKGALVRLMSPFGGGGVLLHGAVGGWEKRQRTGAVQDAIARNTGLPGAWDQIETRNGRNLGRLFRLISLIFAYFRLAVGRREERFSISSAAQRIQKADFWDQNGFAVSAFARLLVGSFFIAPVPRISGRRCQRTSIIYKFRYGCHIQLCG